MRWKRVKTRIVSVVYEKCRALLSVVLVTVSFIFSEKCGAESVEILKKRREECLRSKYIDKRIVIEV